MFSLGAELVDKPTVAIIVLGLVFAFGVAGYFISRAKAWLIPAILTLLLMGLLLLLDWLILSPKERVQIAIDECVEAFLENEPEKLTAHLAPELFSCWEADISSAFRFLEFTQAFASDVKLQYTTQATPRVTADFLGGVHFKSRKGDALLPMERYICRLTIVFQEFEPGKWLIVSVEERPFGQPKLQK